MRPARARVLGGAGAVLLAAVLWGSTGTAAAFAPSGATPVSIGAARIGAARIVIGGLALLLIAWPAAPGSRARARIGGGRAPAGGRAPGGGRAPAGGPGPAVDPATTRGGLCGLLSPRVTRRAVMGAAGVAVYQISFFSAVATTGVAVGTVVAIGSAPVFTGVISRLAGGPRLSRRWMLATAVAIAGAAVLITAGRAAGAHLPGVCLGLLAGLSYAGYAVVAAHLITGGLSERVVMSGLFGGGAVLLLPVLTAGPLGWLLTLRGRRGCRSSGGGHHRGRLPPVRSWAAHHPSPCGGDPRPGRAGGGGPARPDRAGGEIQPTGCHGNPPDRPGACRACTSGGRFPRS